MEDSSGTVENLIKLNEKITNYTMKYFKNDQNTKHSSDAALEV